MLPCTNIDLGSKSKVETVQNNSKFDTKVVPNIKLHKSKLQSGKEWSFVLINIIVKILKYSALFKFCTLDKIAGNMQT